MGTCHLIPHITGKQVEAERHGACLRAWTVSKGRTELEIQMPGQGLPICV